jgi:hypothetical protein
MDKAGFNRILRITLAALTLGFITSLVVVLLQQSKTQYLTLAAGASSGESFILGNALKKVVERHYPRIRLTVLETGGTVENLRMLENGRAQLADAQSDVLPGPRARAFGKTSTSSTFRSKRATCTQSFDWPSKTVVSSILQGLRRFGIPLLLFQ